MPYRNMNRRYLQSGLHLERHRRAPGPLATATGGACTALLAVAIVYLSVRPSPAVAEVSWLPASLAGWADRNGDLRTAVPFFPFCLALALLLELRLKFNPGAALWTSAAAGTVMLLAVESWQLTLPARNFSLADIGWGAAGVAAGCLAAAVVAGFYKRGRGEGFLRLRNRLVGHRTRLGEGGRSSALRLLHLHRH